MAARDELDIPMPAMAPSYRVPPRRKEDMDPATKRLVIFAGVIGAALMVLVGVWSFTGHRQTAVPVIEADTRPLREKPQNPGGMQVDSAADALAAGDPSKQTVAPLPEAPAPQVLKAQEQAAATQAAAAAAATAAAAAQASAAAAQAAAPQPAPQAAAPAAMTVRPEAPPLPALRPHITVPAAKAAPAQVAPTQAAGVQAAPAQPAPMAQAPATKQAAPAPAPAKPVAMAAPAAVPATPAPATAAAPAPVSKSLLGAAQTPAAKPAAAAAATGGGMVQLASLHSEADAQAEWQRLAKKYPDLLGGRKPVISKSVVGTNTFWRIRTSGFADKAQAESFCTSLKAKGGGCTVLHS